MDIEVFIQALAASGIPFTVLRRSGKRGAVIRVTPVGQPTVYIRLKPTTVRA